MSKDKSSDQLPIPVAAQNDSNSIEIIRVWIADNGQHFTIRVGLWDDPAAWGLLLADLVRNIAKSYEQDSALNPETTITRICEAFSAEMESPTDE